MKFPAALLLLATLACCAGPMPPPIEEAAVVQPQAVCRVGRDGGAVLGDRGIGGTGAPSRSRVAESRVAERGIGGTGIVGVVTGFASICVDGLEVRLDRAVAVSVNGTVATAAQLRVGQQVVIDATGSDSLLQARRIAVRLEVAGPVEAIDTGAGVMTVAGQHVVVLPTTWMGSHFGLGSWVGVSGLRQPDGTILASRMDRARPGVLAVRGRVSRDHDTSRIGALVLRGPAAADAKSGMFATVVGRYVDMAAEVTSLEADTLAQDPAGSFGPSATQVIVQALVRVERGTVRLSNGQTYAAGPAIAGGGNAYRNAIVWLRRAPDGRFTATELHYTAYRGQPNEPLVRAGVSRAGGLLPPPEAPPAAMQETQPEAPADDKPTDEVPGPEAPIPDAVPTRTTPAPDDAFTADRTLGAPAIAPLRLAVAR